LKLFSFAQKRHFLNAEGMLVYKLFRLLSDVTFGEF